MITSLLSNSKFLKLWSNQIVLQIAFNMCNYTALLILAYQKNDPAIQALYYTALTLPALIFGFVAGPVVDLVNRKRLILICDVLLAAFLLLYIFFYGNFVMMLVIAFLTASVARFFIPAEAATIPLLTTERDLKTANTLFLFTLLGSVVVGYVLAVPVMELFGGLGSQGQIAPFIIGSICVLLGFVIIATIGQIHQPKVQAKGLTLLDKTWHLFWETVLQVSKNKRISIPLLLLILAELVTGLMAVVLFEYVRGVLMLPLSTITVLLIVPLIAGIVGGALFIEHTKKIYLQRQILLFAVVGIGISFFAMGILPVFVHDTLLLRSAALLEAFVIGICFVTLAVESRTLLQRETPAQMQGRVFSFLDVMIALVTPIPVLIAGFFAKGFGLLETLIAFGVLVVIVGSFGYHWSKK